MAKKLTEAQKTELSFLINNYQKPLEYTKFEAWGHQILEIALYEPGTFPSDPGIGVGLNKKLFNDIDYMNNTVAESIKSQVEKYLPDIPLASIQFVEYDGGGVNSYDGVVIMMITFEVYANQMTTVVTALSGNRDDDKIDFSKFFEAN